MTQDDTRQAIFGVSDGLTSALGVVIPLALLNKSMVIVIFGLAITSAVGMGGGEYLSDGNSSKRSAASMAVASFVGTILPAVPFFFLHGLTARLTAVLLVIAAAITIAEVKATQKGRERGYGETFAVLGAASALTLIFAFATGAAG